MKIISGSMLVALIGAIVFAWLFYPTWVHQVLLVSDDKELLSRLGIFGDSYGALNTLFSGLAFAGIIVSISLQSRELRETRAELQGQKEQFVIQNLSLKKQVFENTFFQLIHLHNEITASIKATVGNFKNKKEVTGRAAIGELFRLFINLEHHYYYPGLAKPVSFSDDYDLFYQIYHEVIGHYFRNIYHILKFIDDSEVNDKKFYANLLRAQLSSDELGLLFFNCIGNPGKFKFKPLVERYCYFEHLPLLNNIEKEQASLFHPAAFGDSEEWKLFLAR